jgi:chromosome segregation ATPase
MGKENEMKRSKINTILSPVYILITLLLIYTAAANAQDSAAKPGSNNTPIVVQSSDFRTTEEKCSSSIQGAKEAYDRIIKGCKDGGFDASSCFSKIADCSNELEETTHSTTSSLWKTLGLNLPQSKASTPAQRTFCPKVSGKTFLERRKDYKRDLKDLDSDLADLKKDIAEEQNELSEGLKKIEDEVTEAQKTLEEDKAEFTDKRREQLNDFTEQQRKTAEDQRVKEMELLKLEGDLVNVNRKLVTEMIALTDQAANRACLSAVRKMRDEILKLEGQANTIQKARERKKNLIGSYNDCMSTYDQRRTSMMESNKQENERINKTIASLKGDLEDQQNALKAAQAQLAEIEKETSERITSAEQRYLSLTQSAMTRMQALNQSSKTKMDAMAEKKAALEAERNELNNELTAMGKMPENTESTITADEVLTEADAGLTALENACKNTECNGFYAGYCYSIDDKKKSSLSREKLKRARGTR